MRGELVEARKALRLVGAPADPPVREMVGQLDGMLRRADAVRGVTPLDSRDLRGWHFVTTGGVLLHESPHGRDDVMNGRYAFVQDSEHVCREGILRLAAALRAWGLAPPRVFVLADRESAALGVAAARALQIPAEPWPAGGAAAPGLVVAYDLAKQPAEVLETLAEHRPGQVLWSHAAGWTDEPPFAADVVTFLYQFNVSPWEAGRLRVDPATSQTVRQPAVAGTAEELAERVLKAEVPAEELADLPKLEALATATATAKGEAAAGAFRASGRRRRHRLDSPVESNRFD